MTRVLVAVAEPSEVRELIRAGHVIAALWGADTVAVHVNESSSAEMVTELRQQGATLELHSGDPCSVVAALGSRDDVAAVVLGSGGDGLRTHLSRFTRTLVTELPTPLLVVPPGSVTGLRRVLVPLNDGAHATPALARWLGALRSSGAELRLLHLRALAADEAYAACVDREPRAGRLWGDELPARFPRGAPAGELVREVGPPVEEIVDRCRPDVADLVVFSWSQTPEDGHAPVVAEALARSRIPVLLLVDEQA